MTSLLVYGTLRPGGTAAVLVPGTLYDLGSFPGIKLEDGETESFVTCERITVDDATLRRLDQYEGYDPDRPDGSLYLRVPYGDDQIYVYNRDLSSQPVVQSGDWLEYVGDEEGYAASLLGSNV